MTTIVTAYTPETTNPGLSQEVFLGSDIYYQARCGDKIQTQDVASIANGAFQQSIGGVVGQSIVLLKAVISVSVAGKYVISDSGLALQVAVIRLVANGTVYLEWGPVGVTMPDGANVGITNNAGGAAAVGINFLYCINVNN